MTTASPSAPEPSVWPYVLPLAGFLALTGIEGYLPTTPSGSPHPIWFPLAYAAKVLAVSAVVWCYRSTLSDLRPIPSPDSVALSIAVGLAVILVWVGLDGRYPEISFLGKRTAFDPLTLPLALRVVFLVARLYGLVLLVPLVEELFYRSFLMRWIVDPVFDRVPIGKVTPLGLAVTTGVFASSHPEWLPAILTGLAWGWLLARTRSVSACVISHATANLVLAVYVLVTKEWKFW